MKLYITKFGKFKNVTYHCLKTAEKCTLQILIYDITEIWILLGDTNIKGPLVLQFNRHLKNFKFIFKDVIENKLFVKTVMWSPQYY